MSPATFWTSSDQKLGLMYSSCKSIRLFPQRRVPEYAVVYHLSGMLQVTEGKQRVDLNPGEVFIANAGVPRFSMCMPINGSCSGLAIIVQRDQMREVIAELGLGNRRSLDDPFFCGKVSLHSYRPLILRAAEVLQSSVRGRDTYLEGFTRQALMEILWNWNPKQITQSRLTERPLLSLRHFVSAVDFMYQCGKYEFSVESLCERLGMSRSNYRRLLHASAQVSPLHLYNQILIERAESLLSRPFDSVKQVALDLGFHSPKQFSQLFRQYAGTSPAEYQRRVRDDKRRTNAPLFTER